MSTAAVKVSEPHWYLRWIDHGCVLCGVGHEDVLVRHPGARPDDPAERVHYAGDHACSGHFL